MEDYIPELKVDQIDDVSHKKLSQLMEMKEFVSLSEYSEFGPLLNIESFDAHSNAAGRSCGGGGGSCGGGGGSCKATNV